MMDTAALAPSPTAYPGFVHLDILICTATDAILIWADHSSANFVKDLKSSFVAGKAELPLELNG